MSRCASWAVGLTLLLAGCSSQRPTAVPSSLALPEGHGRAYVQIRWPEGRSVQAIPMAAAVANLFAYDASGSLLATGTIPRAEGATLGQGTIDLPVGSGRRIEVRLDSATDEGISAGRSGDFSVRRNQSVPVAVTLSPVVRTRFGPILPFSVSGGTTASPGLGRLWSLAVGPDDTLYIPDFSNHAVRAVAPDGRARVVMGQVTDTATQSQGVASTVSGENSGEGGLAEQATLRTPHGLYVAPSGDLFVADSLVTNPAQVRIRYVPATTGQHFGALREAGHVYTINTLGTSFGAVGMVLDTDGALLFTQQSRHEIWRLTTAGTASVMIGGGGDSTTNGLLPAAVALANPWSLALDAQGNLLFSEYLGSRIRMLCRVRGAYYGQPGEMEPGRIYTVMEGPSVMARFGLALSPYPRQLALDRQSNLYFLDNRSHSVFRLERSSGGVSRVAGGVQTSATVPLGDDGPAASASFFLPHGLAIDSRNRLFVGDTLNGRVRWLHL